MKTSAGFTFLNDPFVEMKPFFNHEEVKSRYKALGYIVEVDEELQRYRVRLNDDEYYGWGFKDETVWPEVYQKTVQLIKPRKPEFPKARVLKNG